MFGLVACGTANGSDHFSNLSAQIQSSQVIESSVQDLQDNGENSIANVNNTENAGTGKVLTAYFAVAENSDVDAIPGIIVQLILIPAVMVALNRIGLVTFQRKQPLKNRVPYLFRLWGRGYWFIFLFAGIRLLRQSVLAFFTADSSRNVLSAVIYTNT